MRNLRLLFLVGLATGFISEKLFVSSQSPFSPTDDLYIEGRTSGDVPIDDEDGEDDSSGSGSGDYAFNDLSEHEERLMRFLNLSRTTVSTEMVPSQPQPTADSPHNPPADSQDPTTTVKDTENIQDSSNEEVAGVDPKESTTLMPPSETTQTKFSTESSITKERDEDNSLDRLGVSTTKNSGDEDSKEDKYENVGKDGRGSRIYEIEPPEEVTSENLWERTEVLAAVIACGVVGFLCAVFLLLLLAYRMKKKDEGSYDLGDTKISSTQYQKAPTKEFYA